MEIVLAKHETLVIDGAPRQIRIVCGSGRLWLTRSGDSRDYLLSAGTAMTIHGAGRIVIWALEPSTLQNITATVQAPAGMSPRLVAALSGGR